MSVSALRTGHGDHGTAPLALYAIVHDHTPWHGDNLTPSRDRQICSAVRCFGTFWASCPPPPPPDTHLSNLAFSLNPVKLLARHLKLVEPAQDPFKTNHPETAAQPDVMPDPTLAAFRSPIKTLTIPVV
ncbi:hypothetical protein CFIO01_11904 [Colletotrichum fioriniae PJ7]|uniref:Uncharacterized protein n=1 Tax=Colletotrichum fioriniae PJ7 TaxID=1445577 RepID=A0A010QF21_9PEZI|nr:hypothetical protein CFIO01_11904 [Colletotrichum fioriniae PJ7]